MQSIEERAAAAYELKATGKCNCSQSVVKVFQDKLPVGEDTLMKLTAGYAAGTYWKLLLSRMILPALSAERNTAALTASIRNSKAGPWCGNFCMILA